MFSSPKPLGVLRHCLPSNYIKINMKSSHCHEIFCQFSQAKEFCYLMKESILKYSEVFSFVERKWKTKKEHSCICIAPFVEMKTPPVYFFQILISLPGSVWRIKNLSHHRATCCCSDPFMVSTSLAVPQKDQIISSLRHFL